MSSVVGRRTPATVKAHNKAAAAFMYHSNLAARAGKSHLAKTLMRGYAHHMTHPHGPVPKQEEVSPVKIKKPVSKKGRAAHPMSNTDVHKYLQKLMSAETDEEFFGPGGDPGDY